MTTGLSFINGTVVKTELVSSNEPVIFSNQTIYNPSYNYDATSPTLLCEFSPSISQPFVSELSAPHKPSILRKKAAAEGGAAGRGSGAEGLLRSASAASLVTPHDAELPEASAESDDAPSTPVDPAPHPACPTPRKKPRKQDVSTGLQRDYRSSDDDSPPPPRRNNDKPPPAPPKRCASAHLVYVPPVKAVRKPPPPPLRPFRIANPPPLRKPAPNRVAPKLRVHVAATLSADSPASHVGRLSARASPQPLGADQPGDTAAQPLVFARPATDPHSYGGCRWNARWRHFRCHGDVLPAEGCQSTLQSLSADGGLQERLGGAALLPLSRQLDNVCTTEAAIIGRLRALLDDTSLRTAGWRPEAPVQSLGELLLGARLRDEELTRQLADVHNHFLQALKYRSSVDPIVAKYCKQRRPKRK